VKVGHRQAFIPHNPSYLRKRGFCFGRLLWVVYLILMTPIMFDR
jgi:hypothetical protein